MKTAVCNNLQGKNKNYILPFFWQHGEEESVLREYMRIIHEAGIGAVCVESRPHPDFCGPKWWTDMDIILQEAKERGMRVWILDDSHFPTGFANGAMKDAPEELCRRGICCRKIVLKGDGRPKRVPVQGFLKKRNNKMNMFSLVGALGKKQERKYSDDVLLSVTALPLDEEAANFFERKAGRDHNDEEGVMITEEKKIDLTDHFTKGNTAWRVPRGTWQVALCKLSYKCGAHPNYINMTSEESCRVLIDAVYEPHWEHYKEEFGKTIAGFFSDEPELGNGAMYSREKLGADQDLPWSPAVEQELRRRLGEHWKNELSCLWEQEVKDAHAARIRYVYMDVVTKLVKKAFSEQIGGWCRAHGVEYIGHVVEDMGGHARTGGALGHYFRGLWGQDMAGIDDIGGQVYPQGEDEMPQPNGLSRFQKRDGEFYHYELPRLAASLAALDPKKQGRAMCEIFGNYGWQEGLRLERYLADHFLVNGINYYVPHAFSAKKFPDPDCPPHFYAHGHNPQYRHFKSLMQYMNRVCELISGGKHIAPAAVLYHADAEWTGESMPDQTILRLLTDAQINADLVPVDAFVEREQYRTDLSKGFVVNGQEYRALIIPYAQFVGAELMEAVEQLERICVPVVFVDAFPEGIYAEGSEGAQVLQKTASVVKKEELVSFLRQNGLSEIRLEPGDHRVRYLHYQKDGEDLYFFVNEGSDPYRGIAEVPSVGEVYGYNAWDNCLESAEIEEREDKTGSAEDERGRKNGTTKLRLYLEPLQSSFVIFGERPEADMREPLHKLEERGEKISFCGPWKRSTCVSLSYPAFSGEKEVELPDHLAKEQPKFSGWVRYENRIALEESAAGPDLQRPKEKTILVITDAYEGVEVFVNKKSAGVQATPVYRFDVTDLLEPGDNEIVIEVSTTLERERAYAKNKGMIERMLERKEKAPTGITGEVYLCRERESGRD